MCVARLSSKQELASREIEIVEVFDVRMVSGRIVLSTSASTCDLIFSFSTTASTTRSVPAISPIESDGRMRPSVSAIFAAFILPFSTSFPRSFEASPIPRASASSRMSFMTTGIFEDADW